MSNYEIYYEPANYSYRVYLCFLHLQCIYTKEMKKLSLHYMLVFILLIVIQIRCNNTASQSAAVNTKDSLPQKDTTKKIAEKPKEKEPWDRFFPLQKMSLREIKNLLQGTWAPADDDTIPYTLSTYTSDKRISTRRKGLDNKPSIDHYYLAFDCPPDSILDWGFHRSDSFPCLCHLMLLTDTVRKKVACMALFKITKDSLFITDGENNHGYSSYVRVH